jgi:acetate CoA/acetoacetate CoA-transferase alpha subunit
MNKVKTISEISSHFHDGCTIMVGGFLTVGMPQMLVEAVASSGIKDITLVSSDPGCTGGKGTWILLENRQVKKLYASYVGSYKETGRKIESGEIECELVPQGTLAERIRAGGGGLGGVLTRTGLGTLVETNKRKVNIDGREYLLEMPLKADIALIKACKADTFGNAVLHGSARNFNQVMATAADYVILEAEKIVEVGDIDPNEVDIPGIYVDAIIFYNEYEKKVGENAV